MEVDTSFYFEILKFPSYFVIASLKYDTVHQNVAFFHFKTHSSEHPFHQLKNFKVVVSRMSIQYGDVYFGVMEHSKINKEEDLIWIRCDRSYKLYIISVSREKINRCLDLGRLYSVRSPIANSRKYPNVIYIPRKEEKVKDRDRFYRNWIRKVGEKEIVSFDIEKEKMIRIIVPFMDRSSCLDAKIIVFNRAGDELLMVLSGNEQNEQYDYKAECHDVISGKLVGSYNLKKKPRFCLKNRFLFFEEKAERKILTEEWKTIEDDYYSNTSLQLLDLRKGEFVDFGKSIPLETSANEKKYWLVGMMIHKNQFVVIYKEKVSFQDRQKENKEILYTRICGTEEIIGKEDESLLEERIEFLFDSTIDENYDVFPLSMILQIHIHEKKISFLKSFICI